MPGRNGGTLKRSNTIGVGRKPNEIRLVMADGVDIGLKRVIGILKGNKCVPHVVCGKRVLQYPTQEDFRWAMEYCAKYGLGMPKQELDVDLTTMTQEQREAKAAAILAAIRERAASGNG